MKVQPQYIKVIMLIILIYLAFFKISDASTTQIGAMIGFSSPTSMSVLSEVNFGTLKLKPKDTVFLDTSGSLSINKTSQKFSVNSNVGKILLAGGTKQSISFIPMNYNFGNGIGSLSPVCSVQSPQNNEQHCENTTMQIDSDKDKTLLIGMGMTLNDAFSPANTDMRSSFDFSVVYQ